MNIRCPCLLLALVVLVGCGRQIDELEVKRFDDLRSCRFGLEFSSDGVLIGFKLTEPNDSCPLIFEDSEETVVLAVNETTGQSMGREWLSLMHEAETVDLTIRDEDGERQIRVRYIGPGAPYKERLLSEVRALLGRPTELATPARVAGIPTGCRYAAAYSESGVLIGVRLVEALEPCEMSEAGMSVGTLILAVNGIELSGGPTVLAELQKALSASDATELRIRTERGERTVRLPAREDPFIHAAKGVLASDLQAGQPEIRFEDWLRKVAGPHAEIDWGVTGCGEQTGSPADRERDLPVCVEALVVVPGGSVAMINLIVGTQKKGVSRAPEVYSAFGRDAELTSLGRDLDAVDQYIRSLLPAIRSKIVRVEGTGRGCKSYWTGGPQPGERLQDVIPLERVARIRVHRGAQPLSREDMRGILSKAVFTQPPSPPWTTEREAVYAESYFVLIDKLGQCYPIWGLYDGATRGRVGRADFRLEEVEESIPMADLDSRIVEANTNDETCQSWWLRRPAPGTRLHSMASPHRIIRIKVHDDRNIRPEDIEAIILRGVVRKPFKGIRARPHVGDNTDLAIVMEDGFCFQIRRLGFRPRAGIELDNAREFEFDYGSMEVEFGRIGSVWFEILASGS